MTAREILDSCRHSSRSTTTTTSGVTVHPCRACAERAVEAAREEGANAEREACAGHAIAARDRIVAQAAIVVRLTEPDGATKKWWIDSGRGELIQRSIVVDAVLNIRSAIDGAVQAIRPVVLPRRSP